MTRHVLQNGIPVRASGKFFGNSESEIVKGEVIALEFYKGSVPTFTFKSESGHLFAYLPPNAFSNLLYRHTDLIDIDYPNCAPSISYLNINSSGFGKLRSRVVRWKDYICSLDWEEQNILVHCVRFEDGAFAFLRNSRFQIGGKSWTPPNWKKLRDEWKLD